MRSYEDVYLVSHNHTTYCALVPTHGEERSEKQRENRKNFFLPSQTILRKPKQPTPTSDANKNRRKSHWV